MTVGAVLIEVLRTMKAEVYRPKPLELLNLYDSTLNVFEIIKEEFNVPDTYTLALHDVDAVEPLLNKVADVAAIVMRKIQTLRWLAKPGVETTNDVIVTLAADLQRSLDYLAGRCEKTENADALITFTRKITIAARRVGMEGDIDALR